jgi:hypothetical protein
MENGKECDHFFSTSAEIRDIEQPEGKYYHTNCFSRFCAIKRQPPGDDELSQPPSKVTRSTSDHPYTNEWRELSFLWKAEEAEDTQE